MNKILPWLMLVVTLSMAIVRTRPPQTQPLPTRIRVVHCESSLEFVGAQAIFPLRTGLKGESWSIEDVLATGSRSPLANEAPRLSIPRGNPRFREDIPVLVLSWREGERFGQAVLLGETGLLTSPSTRFKPGLLAATDIAATVTGRPFAAGRPAVLVPGKLADLNGQQRVWEQKARLLRYLVLAPWVLSALLIIAAWRKKSLGSAKLSGIVALMIWGDLLLGSPLMERLPFSYSVTEAARFYGIGNDAAGLLFGCALAAGFPLPMLLAVAVTIGAPSLGANNGCALAALVGLVAMELVRFPKKKRLIMGLIALFTIGALFFGLARWDASRGVGERTHLGQAAAEPKLTLISRKLAMNGHLLVSSPWSLLLLTGSVLLGRRRAWPELIVVGAALALNDSGVLAAAMLVTPLAAPKKQNPPPQSEGGGN